MHDPKISVDSETLRRKKKTGGQMPFVLPSEHCQGPVFTSLHQKRCIPLFVRSMPLKSQTCKSRRYANAEACLLTKGTPVNSSQSRTSNGFCQDETCAQHTIIICSAHSGWLALDCSTLAGGLPPTQTSGPLAVGRST